MDEIDWSSNKYLKCPFLIIFNTLQRKFKSFYEYLTDAIQFIDFLSYCVY